MTPRPRDHAANRFYASKRWRGIRRRKLQRDPLCECRGDCCPPDGCHLPAAEVDHVDGDWRNNAADNHASLTTSCHSRKTRRTTQSRPSRRREPERHPGLL